jgi:hypothetical protein
MTVKLAVEKDGSLQFADQALGQALPKRRSIVEKLRAILNIRRHLGWTVAVELQPKPGVSKQKIGQAVESLKNLQPHLAKPLKIE